jgi:hypothetical protein
LIEKQIIELYRIILRFDQTLLLVALRKSWKYFAEERKSRFRSDQNAAKVRAEAGFVTFSRKPLDIGAVFLTCHEWFVVALVQQEGRI